MNYTKPVIIKVQPSSDLPNIGCPPCRGKN